MSVQRLICIRPGVLELQDQPALPPPPAGWANVSIKAVGICGTDYHIFEGKHPFLAYPRVMGHELSGIISAAGRGVALATGTKVIINPYLACGKCHACAQDKPNCCMAIEVFGVHRDGGMCSELQVPAQNLYPAGELSLRDAATVEFLAIGAHAVRRSRPQAAQKALIVGIGPIGLGVAIFARIAGLDVSLLDTSAERLNFARDELGFSSTIVATDATARDVQDITNGNGFDIVFDATGNARSIESGFAHVAHGGSYVLVSVVRDAISFADPEFHKREMTLIGSRNATREDFDKVVAAILAGNVPLDKLITHRTRLENMPQDMARWAQDKRGLIKAIIDING